ncbi:MAG TPA: Wzz/FepE/Etk N-terminal domain-containing protein [Candidatus Kapabacteria bacterium]
MDFLVIFARRKWMIIGLTVFCGVLAVALTYFVPQTFQSEAKILPPDRISSTGLLSKYNAGYALELLKEIENPSVDLLQNLLESRTLAERLARDSSVHRYYASQGLSGRELVTTTQDAIRVEPGFSKVGIFATIETGWMASANQKEQARILSATMANLAVQTMDSMLRGAIRSLAHDTRVYADSDYATRVRQLDSLGAVQEAFEEAHGLVQLPAQLKASIARVAALKADRDQQDIRLHLLRLDLSNSASSTEEVMAKLSAAEDAAHAYQTEPQIGPAFDSLPEVSKQYAEILRQKAELEPIVNFLRVEAEQERIYEVREKSLITMLDPAQVPEHRISPIRSQDGFLGLIFGFALSLLVVGVRALFLSWKVETQPGMLRPGSEAASAVTIFSRRRT